MKKLWTLFACSVFGHLPTGETRKGWGFADDVCERCGRDIWCVTVTDHDGDWSWYVEQKGQR